MVVSLEIDSLDIAIQYLNESDVDLVMSFCHYKEPTFITTLLKFITVIIQRRKSSRWNVILETYFEPYFDNEQFETAIVNTFDVLYEELVDIYGVPNVQSNTTDAGIDIAMVLFWIVLILFIIILISIMLSKPRYPQTRRTHRYRTPTYRTRPYYAPRPTYRPTTSYRPSVSSRPSRSTFTPSRSSSISRSSIGSRSRGGSSRGFGGGRR